MRALSSNVKYPLAVATRACYLLDRFIYTLHLTILLHCREKYARGTLSEGVEMPPALVLTSAVSHLALRSATMTPEQVSSNASWDGSLKKLKFQSSSLGGLDTQINVYVPPGSGPFPVLYYLAGLTCTEGKLL